MWFVWVMGNFLTCFHMAVWKNVYGIIYKLSTSYCLRIRFKLGLTFICFRIGYFTQNLLAILYYIKSKQGWLPAKKTSWKKKSRVISKEIWNFLSLPTLTKYWLQIAHLVYFGFNYNMNSKSRQISLTNRCLRLHSTLKTDLNHILMQLLLVTTIYSVRGL